MSTYYLIIVPLSRVILQLIGDVGSTVLFQTWFASMCVRMSVYVWVLWLCLAQCICWYMSVRILNLCVPVFKCVWICVRLRFVYVYFSVSVCVNVFVWVCICVYILVFVFSGVNWFCVCLLMCEWVCMSVLAIACANMYLVILWVFESGRICLCAYIWIYEYVCV